MSASLYDVRFSNRAHEVRIAGDDTITLDGEAVVADIRSTDSTGYSVLMNGKSYLFRLAPSSGGYEVLVDGNPVVVTVDTERTRLLREVAASSVHPAAVTGVTAPMPALVVRIEVEAGQEVKGGQGLIVLEAMKMENEIKSPRAGVVKQIHVSQGKAVEKGEVLVTLE